MPIDTPRGQISPVHRSQAGGATTRVVKAPTVPVVPVVAAPVAHPPPETPTPQAPSAVVMSDAATQTGIPDVRKEWGLPVKLGARVDGFLPDIAGGNGPANVTPAGGGGDEQYQKIQQLESKLAEQKRKLTDAEVTRKMEKESVRYELRTQQDRIRLLEAQLLKHKAAVSVPTDGDTAPAPAGEVGQTEELAALRKRVQEAEKNAAACAHLAHSAEEKQAEVKRRLQDTSIKTRFVHAHNHPPAVAPSPPHPQTLA